MNPVTRLLIGGMVIIGHRKCKNKFKEKVNKNREIPKIKEKFYGHFTYSL
jgi:hypothetical protein